MKKFFGAMLTVLLILSAVTAHAAKFGDNYRLEKVLILSRHNLRAPHIKEVHELTNRKWFDWIVNSRELSLRGGLSETALGEYFNRYLIDEGFIPTNYRPAEGEVRFYANAHQRTIATAQFFSSGMLPVANVRIEHNEFEKRDPVFAARLHFMNDKFRADAEKELLESRGVNDSRELNEKFSANLALLNKTLDFKNSPYAKKHNVKDFTAPDAKFLIEANDQPALPAFETAVDASDALILQYYETGTAFGKKLSAKQWQEISDVVGYLDRLVGTPKISVNIARPLIDVMADELHNDARKFTFLCGHETNIISVLGALRVEDYSLPDTVEPRAPIGSKLVIEKRRGADGQAYVALNLVYPSTKQLQNIEPLTLDNPPKIFPLRLKGLQVNADGLYLFDDVMNRFAEVDAEYDALNAG